ncbi:MAG: FAD-dependent oxidoreductase [Candidatus Aenigmatarchaeota archaeon]
MNGIVLGGGLAGLSAAMELSKYCDDVIILESEDYLGGLSSSYDIDGYKIPRFFRHVIDADKVTLKILEELGIFNKFFKRKVKFGIYSEQYDKIFQMNAFKLLFFKPLSFFDRLRFGFFCLSLLLGKEDLKNLDKINAERWLTEKSSKEISQFFGTLIAEHKFAVPFNKVSAAWIFSRFKLELSKSNFLYYPKGKEGFDLFINKLKESVKGEILTKCPVKKIVIENRKIKEIHSTKRKFVLKEDDLVINTLPMPVFLKICVGLPSTERKKLEKIKYTGNICLCLGCKEEITDYYWINIMGKFPFGTMIDHNNLYDEYPWRILYLSNYVSQKDKIWKLSDREVLNLYLKFLEKILKKRIRPIWFKVTRAPYAVPIYRVNFFKSIPNNREFKNLRFAGPYMAFPEDRLMGGSIQSGIDAAKILT